MEQRCKDGLPQIVPVMNGYTNSSDSRPMSAASAGQIKTTSLMGARHPTIVLGTLAAIVSRIAVFVVKQLELCKDKLLETILLEGNSPRSEFPQSARDPVGISISLLEQSLISASHSPNRRLKTCQELIRIFVANLEMSLRRGYKPFSDRKIVSLLPFSSEMKDYLPNMQFLVLQITFPADVMDKRGLLLLLMSRILCTSVEEFLDELQCEDQALVVQETSCYLVTDNHVLEGLVLLSPEQSCLYFIVGYNPEKCSTQMIDRLSCSITECYNKEFPSKYYTIKKLEICADPYPPKNEQYGSIYIAKADNNIEMVAAAGAQESSSGEIQILTDVCKKFCNQLVLLTSMNCMGFYNL